MSSDAPAWIRLLPNGGDVVGLDELVQRFAAPVPVHDPSGACIGQVEQLQRRDDGVWALVRLDRPAVALRVRWETL